MVKTKLYQADFFFLIGLYVNLGISAVQSPAVWYICLIPMADFVGILLEWGFRFFMISPMPPQAVAQTNNEKSSKSKDNPL